MAEILTKFSKPRSDYSVSLLVMGPAELCHKVSEALHESAKERKWRVIVHKCEFVSDITKIRFNLSIDYIIFVFDWRVQSLSEVETNICFIDKHYINCGAVCMVNCQGITKSIGMASHKSTKLRDKYNIRFLCTDISKPQSCIQLGNRILNLVGAVLGITSGIPIIGFPL